MDDDEASSLGDELDDRDDVAPVLGESEPAPTSRCPQGPFSNRRLLKGVAALVCLALPLVGFLAVLFSASDSILSPLDVVVFLCYFVFVAVYGLYVYKRKGGDLYDVDRANDEDKANNDDKANDEEKASDDDQANDDDDDDEEENNIDENTLTNNDEIVEMVDDHRVTTPTTSAAAFFLAEGSLSWWAIGASIIASNISAEHFIGMSGNGFSIGLSISAYEWLAIVAMILTGVFFLPVYIKYRIHTMPQFLDRRFSRVVSAAMAVIWLLLYVCINLTSILYLGALAVSTVTSYPLPFCMAFLGVSAFVVTIGGMKVIGYTDAVQVSVLVLGGLTTTYTAVRLVAERLDPQHASFVNGLLLMANRSADHFQLILPRDHPHYVELPGASILLALNVGNFAYFACNQYIVQRCLGADVATARYGMLFAACLKLFIPVLVVLPGIACYTLWRDGMFQQEMAVADPATGAPVVNQDRAYPVLLNLLPSGLKGLAFAALSAAIISSLASKANSVATIFTLDLFVPARPHTTQRGQVLVGRVVIFCSLLFAVVVSPFLGIEKSGGYQFIQQMTGFLTPGILATFVGGLFWPRTNVAGAITALAGGFVVSAVVTFVLPPLVDLSPLAAYGLTAPDADGVYVVPFLDLMMYVFVLCAVAILVCGLLDPASASNPRSLVVHAAMFKTTPAFLAISVLLTLIIIALYILFW